MSSGKKVFNNTLILYVKMFITVIPSLYATRLLLSELGVENFGILNLTIGIMSMLGFLNAALSNTSLRFMAYAKGKNDYEQELKVFNITLLLHFLLALILVIIFFSSSSFIIDNLLNIGSDKIEATKILMNCLIVGMFFTVVSVPYDAIINSNEDIFFVAVIGILESLLKLSAAIFISNLNNDKLIIYGYLLIVISFLLFFSKLIFAHVKYSESKINLNKYFDKELFKEIFSFSAYNTLGLSFQMLSFYGQGVVLNMFFGTIVNAAQGIVNQISGQLSSFAGNMQKALRPMLIKSEGSGNREKMLSSTLTGNRLSFFMLMFFYIPVLIELDAILKLWLVNVPEYTIKFAQFYFIANLISQLYLSLGAAIESVGKIKRFKIYCSILSLLPLPISYFLFKNNYPPETIYMVFIFYTIFDALLHILIAKKECNLSIKEFIQNVIVKSFTTFCLIFLIVLIPHYLITEDYYRLIAVFVINFLVYIPIVWIFGLSNNEKEFVKNYKKNFKRK